LDSAILSGFENQLLALTRWSSYRGEWFKFGCVWSALCPNSSIAKPWRTSSWWSLSLHSPPGIHCWLESWARPVWGLRELGLSQEQIWTTSRL